MNCNDGPNTRRNRHLGLLLAIAASFSSTRADEVMPPERRQMLVGHGFTDQQISDIEEAEWRLRRERVAHYLGQVRDTGEASWVYLIGECGLRPGEGVPVLEGLLRHERPDVRAAAAFCLGEHYGPQAFPAIGALVKNLRMGPQNVTGEAAAALGAIGPLAAAAVPALVDAYGEYEGSSSVRGSIVAALGQIGEAAPSVLAVLKDAYDSNDAALGRAAFVALNRIVPITSPQRDMPTQPELFAGANARSSLLRLLEVEPDQRDEAIEVLAKAYPGLLPGERLVAMDIFASAGSASPTLASLLLESVTSEDPAIAEAAWAAVGSVALRDLPENLELVARAMGADDDRVAAAAAELAIRLGRHEERFEDAACAGLRVATGGGTHERIGTYLDLLRLYPSGRERTRDLLASLLPADSRLYWDMPDAATTRGFVMATLAEYGPPVVASPAIEEMLANHDALAFTAAARALAAMADGPEKRRLVAHLRPALEGKLGGGLVTFHRFARTPDIDHPSQNTNGELEAMRALATLPTEAVRSMEPLLRLRAGDPEKPWLAESPAKVAREILDRLERAMP